jgi:hypothetical protein
LAHCDLTSSFSTRSAINSSNSLELDLLALGFRSQTDIPALKELEEWFEAQKEMRAVAKLNRFFERTSKFAARRLKREIERRGTLGEFALEPELSHLEKTPREEKRL